MQKIILGIFALAALAGGVYFSQLWTTPVAIEARVFEPVRAIKPFELINQHDKKFNNDLFKDQWTMIFLGYTHCPDVCPTTLAKLSGSYNKLKATGIDNLQVLFVSVDPQRDDAARLKEYTEYFHQDFIGASGSHANLYPFVRDLGLMYSMSEDTSQAEYAVNHSGGIALVNPDGQLHAMFRPKTELGGIPDIDMVSLEADFQQLSARF